MSQDSPTNIKSYKVSRQEDVFAVSTPIAGPDGQVSKKTPVFHLPVYNVELNLEKGERVDFTCDLADMTDLLGKLKALENHWIKFGQSK